MSNLDFAIRSAWEKLKSTFFCDQNIGAAEEVCTFIANWLDAEPIQNHQVRRYWRPLSPQEKHEALLNAIPPGNYAKEGWVLVDENGRFLAIDGRVSNDIKDADIFDPDEEAKSYWDDRFSAAPLQIRRRIEDMNV